MAGNAQYPIDTVTESALVRYASHAHALLTNQYSLRQNMMMIDRYYQREGDWTEDQVRARIENRRGDKSKIQNVTVPIVEPQVQATLAYLVNLFLTGYPIFGVVGDKDSEDAALQIETLIGENAIHAGWAREITMFFLDGLKYNLCGLELTWQQQNVGDVETVLSGSSDATNGGARAKKKLWSGNVIRRLDMYNTFFDPRVSPARIHIDGEFAGYVKLLSRVKMKEYMNDLFGKVSPDTVRRAFETAPASGGNTSSGTPFSYFRPLINPFPVVQTQQNHIFDWYAWATNEVADSTSNPSIRYQNIYELMVLYARIIPRDFGMSVPEPNTPQIWKFVIINGQVVLYAERQTNAHNYIPMFFGQPREDGLDYQTKSFASNVIELQDVASSLMTGFLASKRRLVGDRVLYDPSRITEKNINSTSPAAKIPVRPSAYGKPVQEAVYQFPFRDEQVNSLLEGVKITNEYANLVNNTNPAQQGQFVPGNKTLKEYQDTMGHGNAGNQVIALMIESQVFTPAKEAMLLNYMQYQQPTKLLNRGSTQGAGSTSPQTVDIKPEELREAALHFKVTDGLLPTEKEMSTDEFQVALQVIGSSPQVSSEFNMGELISYLFKIRGADVTPFMKPKEQIQYEQQLAAWQQAAEMAAKQGTPFSSPMPQPPEALQQQQQAAQQQSGPQGPAGQELLDTLNQQIAQQQGQQSQKSQQRRK